jgi:hypothetical protein
VDLSEDRDKLPFIEPPEEFDESSPGIGERDRAIELRLRGSRRKEIEQRREILDMILQVHRSGGKREQILGLHRGVIVFPPLGILPRGPGEHERPPTQVADDRHRLKMRDLWAGEFERRPCRVAEGTDAEGAE